jgi:hypothetical protein
VEVSTLLLRYLGLAFGDWVQLPKEIKTFKMSNCPIWIRTYNDSVPARTNYKCSKKGYEAEMVDFSSYERKPADHEARPFCYVRILSRNGLYLQTLDHFSRTSVISCKKRTRTTLAMLAEITVNEPYNVYPVEERSLSVHLSPRERSRLVTATSSDIDFKLESSVYGMSVYGMNLVRLHFSHMWNRSFEPGELPKTVREIVFGGTFDKPLTNIPYGVETIVFSGSSAFNQPLDDLPDSVKNIDFASSSQFDTPISKLPKSLETLYMGLSSFYEGRSPYMYHPHIVDGDGDGISIDPQRPYWIQYDRLQGGSSVPGGGKDANAFSLGEKVMNDTFVYNWPLPTSMPPNLKILVLPPSYLQEVPILSPSIQILAASSFFWSKCHHSPLRGNVREEQMSPDSIFAYIASEHDEFYPVSFPYPE